MMTKRTRVLPYSFTKAFRVELELDVSTSDVAVLWDRMNAEPGVLDITVRQKVYVDDALYYTPWDSAEKGNIDADLDGLTSSERGAMAWLLLLHSCPEDEATALAHSIRRSSILRKADCELLPEKMEDLFSTSGAHLWQEVFSEYESEEADSRWSSSSTVDGNQLIFTASRSAR